MAHAVKQLALALHLLIAKTVQMPQAKMHTMTAAGHAGARPAPSPIGSSRSKNCNGSPNVSINLLAHSIGKEIQSKNTALTDLIGWQVLRLTFEPAG